MLLYLFHHLHPNEKMITLKLQQKESKKSLTSLGEVILIGKKCPTVFILTVGALAVTEHRNKNKVTFNIYICCYLSALKGIFK